MEPLATFKKSRLFLTWNITSYLKLYSDYIEVNCFWFFLVNSCWLIYELMLVFANLTIRTEICFYILICTRFFASKGVGYFFASLSSYIYKKGCLTNLKQKKIPYSSFYILFGLKARWFSNRYMIYIED